MVRCWVLSLSKKRRSPLVHLGVSGLLQPLDEEPEALELGLQNSYYFLFTAEETMARQVCRQWYSQGL